MLYCNVSTASIVNTIGCSIRTAQRRRKQLECPPESKVVPIPSNPFIRIGRASYITPYMQQILCEQLLKQPDMYRYEMDAFLYERTGVTVSVSAVGRTLKSMQWSRKVNRRVAKQRDETLRDYYAYKVSHYKADQLVFVDESGCDKKAGQRRWGWAPLGKAPVKVDELNRDVRHQILPAYTLDGIILARLYVGSTDAQLFEDFIEQLVQHCGRFPEPKSVLVMDNASWHNKGRVEEICERAGMKVLFLPPYSPDYNPIEEFFSELKTYIQKHWDEHLGLIKVDFKAFLRICIRAVGSRKESARGHFRHSGLIVEEPSE